MTDEKSSRTIVELNFRNRLPALMAAAEKLGSISLRVIDDPVEALGLLREQIIAEVGAKYPETSEEERTRFAATRWPESSVGDFNGPGAAHAVTEITLSGEHGLSDLHHTAKYGEIYGRSQV